jgi:hypothetical protein
MDKDLPDATLISTMSLPYLRFSLLAAMLASCIGCSSESEPVVETPEESKIWADTIESHPDFANNPFRSGNMLFGDSFEAGCWRAKQVSGSSLGTCPENPGAPLWTHAQMQVWPEGEGQSSEVVGTPHPVRDGKKSLRLEWRRNHVDGTNVGKKAMLHGAKADTSDGLVRWYAWSMFLPSAGASPDAFNFLIFQVHSGPDYHLGEPWRRPFLSLRIDPKGLLMRTSWDSARVSPKNENIDANETVHLVAERAGFFDRWIDFVLRIRTAYHQPDGSTELWINGKKVVDLHNVRLGHNDVRGGFPSFGIYRPGSRGEEEENWLYLDAVRIGGENATYEEMTSHLPLEPTSNPASPNFTASPDGREIALTWAAGPLPESGLQLERRISEGRTPYRLDSLPADTGWAKIGDVESATHYFTDTGVQRGVTYHYRLAHGTRVLAATGPVSLKEP